MFASGRSEIVDIGHAVDVALKVDWRTETGDALEADLVALQEVTNRLDALTAQVTGAYTGSGWWAEAGHRSPNAAVRHRCRVPGGQANRLVARARRLATMPVTADAYRRGAITQEHVDVLVRVNQPGAADAFRAAEQEFVGWACDPDLTFKDFARLVAYWSDVADPQAAEDRADHQVQRREAHLATLMDGMERLEAWFEPLGGAELRLELERLESAEFESDWKEARARLGDDATVADLSRTAGQRRADALVQMARNSSSATAPASPRYRVNLLLDWKTFTAELALLDGDHSVSYPAQRTCETEAGTILAPSVALDAALAGEVRRLVFGADSTRMDFARSRRLFTGGVAEAIRLRHRTCAHPGCEITARRCQVDHITEWADGGATDHTNAQPLCATHNRWKSRRRRQPPPA